MTRKPTERTSRAAATVPRTEKEALTDQAAAADAPGPAVDQLIANKDRNYGNIMITRSWEIWIIDHTRAFRPYKELLQPGDLVRCDRALLEGMRRLDRKTLAERLGTYLTSMEIDGLLARRDRIVKFFDDKSAREGTDAVLFDYLAERRAAGPAKTD